MDEIKIKLTNGFMKGILGKLISKMIFDKTGIKPVILINSVSLEKEDNKIHVHLNIDADIEEKALLKINRLIDEN